MIPKKPTRRTVDSALIKVVLIATGSMAALLIMTADTVATTDLVVAFCAGLFVGLVLWMIPERDAPTNAEAENDRVAERLRSLTKPRDFLP